jgi:hypothetical protein
MTHSEAIKILVDKKLHYYAHLNKIIISKTPIDTMNYGHTLWFRFERQSLPFCCGLDEIGAFKCSSSIDQHLINFGISEDVVLALLSEQLQIILDLNVRENKKRLIIFNLINTTACNLWEKMIHLYFKNEFTILYDFINANSDNRVKTYVQID